MSLNLPVVESCRNDEIGRPLRRDLTEIDDAAGGRLRRAGNQRVPYTSLSYRALVLVPQAVYPTEATGWLGFVGNKDGTDLRPVRRET